MERNPITLVAETSNIVGLLWGYRKPEEGFDFLSEAVNEDSFYLDDVAVAEERRKEGIGTKLCEEFEEQVIENGGTKVFLRTEKEYEASNTLFKSLGYERTGIFDPKYPKREYFVKEVI